MDTNFEQCEVCAGAFDFLVTDVVKNVVDRRFCRRHFDEYTTSLPREHDGSFAATDHQFWLRSVVFGRNDDYQYYLEFSHGRFFIIAGGHCENSLLRSAALRHTYTLHAKLTAIFGFFSAQMKDVEVLRLDSNPDDAMVRFETQHGHECLEVRVIDAIAVGTLFNLPMYISSSLHSQIEWGIMWGQRNYDDVFVDDQQRRLNFLHDFENSVKDSVIAILQERQGYFAVHGITYGEVTIKASETIDVVNYGSVLSVPFQINNVDLWPVECPIIRKGKPLATLNTIAIWFDRQINFSEIVNPNPNH